MLPLETQECKFAAFPILSNVSACLVIGPGKEIVYALDDVARPITGPAALSVGFINSATGRIGLRVVKGRGILRLQSFVVRDHSTLRF